MDNFSITQRKKSNAATNSTLSLSTKDEWDTKEDTGKSMNAIRTAVQL